MSILPSATGNDFFTLLPPEMAAELVPYLRGTGDENDSDGIEKDKALIRTSQVCQLWRDEPALVAERVNASLRLREIIRILHDYPTELIEVFQKSGLSITRLPKAQETMKDPYSFFGPHRSLGPIITYERNFRRSGIMLNIIFYDTPSYITIEINRSFGTWELKGPYYPPTSDRGEITKFLSELLLKGELRYARLDGAMTKRVITYQASAPRSNTTTLAITAVAAAALAWLIYYYLSQ